MQINKMHSYTTMENLIYNKSNKMLNLFIQLKKPSIQCCWVGWEAFHLDKVNGIVHHLHDSVYTCNCSQNTNTTNDSSFYFYLIWINA